MQGRTALTLGRAGRLSQRTGRPRYRLYPVRGRQGQRAPRPRLPLRLRQVLVLRFRGHERHECHESRRASTLRRRRPRVRPRLSRLGRDPGRSDRAARPGPHAPWRRTGRQRRRHHSGMDRRHHRAAGRLHRRGAPPRPVRRRPAALRHRRGQPRRASRPALGRAPAHAGDLPELQHAGLPHPAERLRPATDLRRHAGDRGHRKARGRRQRGRRRGDRDPVSDPVERPGGRLEPPAALPGRDVGLHQRPGRGHPGRRLHPGQAEAWRPSCATRCRT